MDLKRVEELIELMRESGVTQLSLELPDFKVSITRGPQGTEVSQTGVRRNSEGMPSAVEQPEADAAPEQEAGVTVASPVVGVFHNGGMLDPRELVRQGDRVREGQLLAAIEAMKVPNELRAPTTGMVTHLLVEDGSAVEYGQTLFVIDPDDRGEVSDAEPPIGLA
jgi:acetyl-CoA carboxylase biotin carboxyl carrier protein